SLMRDVSLGGVPSRVAIVGAASSGKSRLVVQAADAFPEARLVTISPGRGLAGLARSLLPVRAWDDPDALAEAAAAQGVPGCEAGLSVALGASPAGADPAVALARWLNGMAAERPVFLVLDRWSELEPDLMAVVEALEGWRSGALLTLYLGAVTPGGMPVIELAPLEPGDAQSLVMALAGPAAESGLTAVLNDAAGLPGLLVAAGRSLALRQGRSGSGPLVAQLAQNLASLTAEARLVLAAGTHLTPEFDLNALAALVGDAAEPGVELASQRGWIVPVGGFRRARDHVGLATFVFAAPLVEQAAREFRSELPLESLPTVRTVDSLDGALSWRKLVFEGLLPSGDTDLDP
ncbi:MAG TPA: hypothetical protein VHN99_10785, partial [Deinococcales bacterium]|nr:hypothetical protein [Deinococcales bacterium]